MTSMLFSASMVVVARGQDDVARAARTSGGPGEGSDGPVPATLQALARRWGTAHRPAPPTAWSGRALPWVPRCSSPSPRLLLGPRFLDVLGHDVLIRLVPVRLPRELAALHLPDLYPASALVIVRRDLKRREQTPQRETLDLLEAGLHVGAGDLAVGLGLDRVADSLDGHCRPHDAAVVVDGGGHLLGGFLALLLVHLADLVEDREEGGFLALLLV